MPLSGGKEKTVMASFFWAFCFLRSCAQLMARLHSEVMRSGSECDLPVLESRPANTMGSMAPSSSGRATWVGEVVVSSCMVEPTV